MQAPNGAFNPHAGTSYILGSDSLSTNGNQAGVHPGLDANGVHSVPTVDVQHPTLPVDVPAPTDDEDGEEEEDEHLDADGLRSVESCLAFIFVEHEGDPSKRLCQLCR
jgi:hypothetical protein